jgi:hypothetical protein
MSKTHNTQTTAKIIADISVHRYDGTIFHYHQEFEGETVGDAVDAVSVEIRRVAREKMQEFDTIGLVGYEVIS